MFCYQKGRREETNGEGGKERGAGELGGGKDPGAGRPRTSVPWKVVEGRFKNGKCIAQFKTVDINLV